MLKLNFPRHTLMLSEDRKEIVNFDMVQSIKIIDCDDKFEIRALFADYDTLLEKCDTEEKAQQELLNLLEKLTKEETYI